MATIEQIQYKGKKMYHFVNDTLEVYINPEDGMNIVCVLFAGQEIVSYDEQRALMGKTYGVPILFPTPNRTRDWKFSFAGESHKAFMHGIVKNEIFEVILAEVRGDTPVINGKLVISKDSHLYQEFPYACALTVKIALKQNEIQYRYEVENLDDKRVPFGFALHPFFNKLQGDTELRLAADTVMIKDEESLPTGECIAVAGTGYDLRNNCKVSDLNLDDVYMDLYETPQAVITYDELAIHIDGSDDFSHMVIYTPQKESFFCVEPQTCSTDAINFYTDGKVEMSGLRVVMPGETLEGCVTFHFETK